MQFVQRKPDRIRELARRFLGYVKEARDRLQANSAAGAKAFPLRRPIIAQGHVNRQLSQQEIDAVFQNLQDRKRETPAARFDFRRPDRIPKSQVRAIHLLHDTFVRNLVSSLSAYLRSYLTVNLVSVEQLSYAEFLDGLPSPTCMVSLGLRPTTATACWN